MLPAHNCLEALKKAVLSKCALTAIDHCHAHSIALLVLADTKLYLSETAVLRLFNMLPARFPPSPFTKDALSRFCGYENYSSFCVVQEKWNSNNVEGNTDMTESE